ncbi:MAG: MTH938/NDUFAF3 family protein [Candidatus Aminicenantales bacterium]
MIDAYDFGKMTVDGHVYNSDLIIYPRRIESPWWRKSGHTLHLADIPEILQEEPEVIIIGTGFFGLMREEKEVRRAAQDKKISLVVEKTREAVRSFNRIAPQKKTVGAFHLTC